MHISKRYFLFLSLSYFSFFQYNDTKAVGINYGLVKKIKNVDILFVHWVTNFVNMSDIYQIQKKHDQFNF